MARWAIDYAAKTKVEVSYMPIGSAAGIHQIKSGAVAFGASDKPLPPDELSAAGLAQFPIVIGGVVPVVNLDGVAPGQLSFTGELLAAIYLGKVTHWNDPAIAALNPGIKLPNLRISVMHRADGSGTTFNWVNYLSKVSPDWKSQVGEGTSVKWPTGSEGGGNGNEGVARLVTYIKGSIGYVELAFAIQQRMTFAKVKNKAGVFISPTMESFQAAAANADWSAPDFYEVLTDAPGQDSWPITATVFVLIPRHAKVAAQSAEALKFFKWSLENGTSAAKTLNYVPLPAPLIQQVESYWTQNVK
jgi:phosphate transport system substrate-binding protein